LNKIKIAPAIITIIAKADKTLYFLFFIIQNARSIISIVNNKNVNIIIAFIIGLTLGTLIILAIEYFDNTVKTPEDVEKYLDLPVIGTIPIFPKS
jgi:capsular polysaccharide biosynthesis protein